MGSRVSRVKIESDLLTQLSNKTQFTEEDLKSWHIAFLSECPNGRLSQREFASIFRKLFPLSASPRKKDPSNIIFEDYFKPHLDLSQLLFRGFPTSPDNTTDFNGFATVLSTICRGTIGDKASWLFGIIDREGRGTISHKEITDAFAVLISFIQSITGQEVGNSTELAELRTNQIFYFLEKGEEDRISNSDLLNWIEGNEEVIKHLDIFLNKV